MKVFYHNNDIPSGLTSVVSTGTFDGVHLGHRIILNEMCRIARMEKLESVVITFQPHPRIVLHKDENKLKLLTSLAEKLDIFNKLCIDNVFVIEFTREFASMPYENYVKDFLVEKLGARHIVLGFNHHFGEKRTGNHNTLLELSVNYGYGVTEVAQHDFERQVVSSTHIRQLLDEQNLELANKLLGYYYAVTGTVTHGSKRGRILGYPTANIAIEDPYKQLPAVGVYAVQVLVESKTYKGMCSVGYNPTFGPNDLSIEVNIFDFIGDIYGKHIKLCFVSFLRPEIKFSDPESLRRQLNEDKRISLVKLNPIHE